MPSKFFLTSLCFICFCTLWSQSPGYMGKKTIAGYGVYTSPVTFGSTANNQSLFGNYDGSSTQGYLRFNVAQELFIERTIAKSTSFGLALRHIHTGYDNRASVVNSYERPSHYYTIRAFTATALFKKYFKRFLAPWGSYFVFGPTVTQMRSQHDAYMNLRDETPTHDTLYTDFGSDSKRHYRGDLLLGFGKNRILFNRLSLDYGLCFQAVSALLAFEALDSDLLGSRPQRSEYIERTMKARLRGANRFNVFFKIGYLF